MWPFRFEQVHGNQPFLPQEWTKCLLCRYFLCGIWTFGAVGEFLKHSTGSTSQISTRMCLCMCVNISGNGMVGDDTNVVPVNDFTITYKFYKVRVWVILFVILFPVPWKVKVIKKKVLERMKESSIYRSDSLWANRSLKTMDGSEDSRKVLNVLTFGNCDG